MLVFSLAACALPHARLREGATDTIASDGTTDAIDDLAVDVTEDTIDVALDDTRSDRDAIDDQPTIDGADVGDAVAVVDATDASDDRIATDTPDVSTGSDVADAADATDASDEGPADSAPCAMGTFDCGDGRCRAVRDTIATCADARNDDVYVLTVGGTPWCGRCQAFGGGDRFVLVLKADGTPAGSPTPQRFSYDSTLWTNMETYAPHNVNRDRLETKTRGMLVYPLREVLVEMSTGSENRTIRGALVTGTGTPIVSFRTIFLGGENSYGSQFSDDAWLGAVPDSRLQLLCRRSGFNVRTNDRDLARVRMGAIGNENGFESCNTHDSWVGVGGVRGNSEPGLSFSAGNVARANFGSDRTIRSFATVWIR